MVCKNGVRIVLENIPTVRSVAIGVWIHTGSKDENLVNNGISHFLEHMFFKGTKTKSAKEIAESFDSIGGQVNAFTSKEYTCYYAKVMDTHAKFALDVLADMFFNSTFDQTELNKEKNVVNEEIKMYEDAPDDIVHDLVARAAFGDHSLAYPILGTKETLDSFDSQKLKDYVRDMYTPEKVVISVAGNISEDFMNEVEALFGQYDNQKVDVEQHSVAFMPNKLARKKETEQAHLCMAFEGLPIGHKKNYHLTILNNILGGTMSSRLFQDVREEKGLAYSVFSYQSTYKDIGLVTLYGGTGNEQLDELYNTMKQTVDTLVEHGITEKELANSKEQLKGGLMLSLESTNSRMSRNGKNELLLGRHKSLDEMVEQIDAVTLEEVNELAKEIFSKDCAVAVINPTGTLPSQCQ